MRVEYRNMLPEDEDAVFDLRLQMWGGPSREYARQGAYLDPLYSQHTFLAVDEQDTLLSCLRYYARGIPDAEGTRRKVGCVASVVTVEAARRQGHARNLMQMAIEAMRREELDWTLLSASDMAIPLYEGLGYRILPTPFYRGLLPGGLLENKLAYTVQRIEPPFDVEDENWQAVRNIYAAYNEHRPLSLDRDDAYWRGYFARRLLGFAWSSDMALFLARSGSGQAIAYLLAYSRRPAPDGGHGAQDPDFTIGEIGILPGQNGALMDLLSSATGWASQVIASRGHSQEAISGAVLLPREEPIEAAVRSMFGSTLQMVDDRTMMARPISNDFSEEELDATFAAPGAHFWMMDDF